MRVLLAALGLLALSLSGCSDSGPVVREIEIRIGYASYPTVQYLTPKEIVVKKGENIRFVITNADKPGSPDSFHDVAFRIPGYDGLIEHEVSAGRTTKTCVPDSDPARVCDEDKSYFTPTETGRYKIWCEAGGVKGTNPDGTPMTGHEQKGMWGTVIIE